MKHDSLDCLFEARRVAIVGASQDASRTSGATLAYLLEHGFDGEIFPVNPNRAEVQGRTAYRALGELQDVDLAVIAVAAERAREAALECAAARVRAAVIFSGGFGEAGEAGRALEHEIRDVLAKAGVRLLGPNCAGLMNAHTGLLATFVPVLRNGLTKVGPVGLISQSGAVGQIAYVRFRERGVRVGHWATTGNEADVDLAECLHYLAHRDDVSVIAAFLESVRNGPRLIAALRAAAERNKPVVLLKAGRTMAGQRAAESHTGALSNDDAVADTVFREFGVYRAASLAEFVDLAYGLSFARRPRGPRTAVVTGSGGIGVLMADEAERCGLEMPPPGAATAARLRALVPAAGVANPFDMTGVALNKPDLLGEFLRLVIDDPAYDSVIAWQGISETMPGLGEVIRRTWRQLGVERPDKLVIANGSYSPSLRAEIEGLGFPVFEDPNTVMQVLAALVRLAQPRTVPEPLAQPAAAVAAGRPVDEAAALRLLQDAGVPVVAHRLAADGDAAAEAAAEIGFPVALKIVSPDIVHKTEIGGVRLGLPDASAVREAFDAVIRSARRHRPSARLTGCLVAAMHTGGVETLAGIQVDPTFGPLVVFGSGGIRAELYADVGMRLAPLSETRAREMIGETKVSKLLRGFRGTPAADCDALAAALVALSRFAVANRSWLGSVDVNPLLVTPSGAIALDAVVIPAAQD